MKLLSIETSSSNCSIAISAHGEVFEKTEVAVKQQGAVILPMIKKLLEVASLDLAQIDALVFSSGPGSFTGLRIAGGIVQGLAFALEKPVIAVPTMWALAYAVAHKFSMKKVEIVINARMNEFFYGYYQVSKNGVKTLFADSLVKNQIFLAEKPVDSDLLIYNDCLEFHKEFIDKYRNSPVKLIEDFYPTASMLLPIAEDKFNKGEVLAADKAIPTYLRGKSAWHTSWPVILVDAGI
ncbi:MAG: tRNA (adenosine(37)-N6)-threonylcarbamoyltransferase complex dimerization subunit type 1 TsaB [Gammaproteobacteria bacterium]|nr:tRNA (adenosine(37)-N6)-threonylcarbamoyltransferase complex dimerization subunit type 1 TsaB [Gammaproteobacteria bacterium]